MKIKLLIITSILFIQSCSLVDSFLYPYPIEAVYGEWTRDQNGRYIFDETSIEIIEIDWMGVYQHYKGDCTYEKGDLSYTLKEYSTDGVNFISIPEDMIEVVTYDWEFREEDSLNLSIDGSGFGLAALTDSDTPPILHTPDLVSTISDSGTFMNLDFDRDELVELNFNYIWNLEYSVYWEDIQTNGSGLTGDILVSAYDDYGNEIFYYQPDAAITPQAIGPLDYSTDIKFFIKFVNAGTIAIKVVNESLH